VNLDLLSVDGVFSTADAARHGLDKNGLARLTRSGQCVRLARGWYGAVHGQAPTPERLHRLRALALGRQFASRAAISHHSLLLVRDLPTFAARLDVVHLTSIRPAQVTTGGDAPTRPSVTVRRPGLVVHRPVPGIGPSSPTAVGRPATMPLALAIVQAGLLAGPEAALVPADAALRAELTTVAELGSAVVAFAGHTGIGPVRAALPHASGLHESPGETRTAFVLRLLGFELEPQVLVPVDGRPFRADFRVKGTRVLVEFDGALKYRDDDGRALFAEKQREDALRRAGWLVVRIVWADLMHPERLRRRVLEALALAA
jgi:very-short-patch-repair endonuclease